MNRPFLALATAIACCAAPSAQTIYPTGTTIWNPARSFHGYTMFEAPTGEAVLIDMDGTVVNKWTSPIAGHILYLPEPLRNGHILTASRLPNTRGAQEILELDWFGNTVWSYTLPAAVGFVHHDLERLPNGNTLLLASRILNSSVVSPNPIADDFIAEVDPGGNIVWTWYTSDHFNELGFNATAKSMIANLAGDWAHTNSVSPVPPNQNGGSAFTPGNLIVSQRTSNIIFIIDRTTGSIVWRTGPNNNVTQGQHAPYMIPEDLPGAGQILVFDNGAGTGYPQPMREAPGFSRVLEIDPLTKQIGWNYDAAASGSFSMLFYDAIVSNARRLPNGNTLICSGVRGRLFEVARSGDVVWEYMSPFKAPIGGSSGRVGPLTYRAFRVPRSWPPFASGK